MPSRKGNEESEHRDLFSTAETRAMLEEFRALVRAGVLKVTPENEVVFVNPPAPEPETEPPAATEEIRLLDKQLLTWIRRNRQRREEEARRAEPKESAQTQPITEPAPDIRTRVVERVAEKILETWGTEDLRDDVIERLSEDLLKSWKRDL